MARFTTRVELVDVDEDDYEDLHDFMKAEGFTRTISTGETIYKLPPAEYNLTGDFTINNVLGKAKAAAAKTKLEHRILVTEAGKRRIYNLLQD